MTHIILFPRNLNYISYKFAIIDNPESYEPVKFQDATKF